MSTDHTRTGAVAAGKARVRQLVKLWSGTPVTNLVGGWAIMWVVMTAHTTRTPFG